MKWGVSRGQVLADILLCSKCGHKEHIEDWSAPIVPISATSCCNCGSNRHDETCEYCGLSAQEDKEVHLELRDLIAPGRDFLSTARHANKMGRRLIALKLSTAAVLFGEPTRIEAARALRVWLLSAVGEEKAALKDAKMWVEQSAKPTQLAWGSLGQQCEHQKLFGDAVEAYRNALKVDPQQHLIRGRLAKLLLDQNREGQAINEVHFICEATTEEKFIQPLLPVVVQMLEKLEERDSLDESAKLLRLVGESIKKSPHLLAHAARINALAGKNKEAAKQLKLAQKLEPGLPIYARVESMLSPTQTSWRKW